MLPIYGADSKHLDMNIQLHVITPAAPYTIGWEKSHKYVILLSLTSI